MKFSKEYLLISFLLLLIAYIITELIKCRNKDKFCQCNGMETKVCVDPQLLKQLYAENILTETNLPAKGHAPF